MNDSGNLPKDIKIYESIEKFDENLPETVKILKSSEHNIKIYLIGTAHFSKKSQDDVSLVIRNVNPSFVMLELCPQRIHLLYSNDANLLKENEKLTLGRKLEIIKNYGFVKGLVFIQFTNTAIMLTKQLEMAPGGECRRALTESSKLPNCKILLGDRPISITMHRAIDGMTMGQKIKLLFSILMENKKEIKLTENDVEVFKKKENFNQDIVENNYKNFPSFYNAFVKERDKILSYSLQLAANQCAKKPEMINRPIVGIVGMGHMPGILKYWETVKKEDLNDFLKISNNKLWTKLTRLSIFTAGACILGYGWHRNTKRSKV